MPPETSVSKAALMIAFARSQVGKPYVLGSEGPVSQALGTWDCSELVQHAVARAGVLLIRNSKGKLTPIDRFDGAGNQWAASCFIPFAAGLSTPGALLFIRDSKLYPAKPHFIGHVAISLGNMRILEARGRRYGVVEGPVRPSFNLATKVRELYP